jgi:hypothetical protein
MRRRIALDSRRIVLFNREIHGARTNRPRSMVRARRHGQQLAGLQVD